MASGRLRCCSNHATKVISAVIEAASAKKYKAQSQPSRFEPMTRTGMAKSWAMWNIACDF